MAHPAASSSQPAQIPALDNQHAHTDKAPKEKKGQGKPANNTSEFPLEVRVLSFDFVICFFK